MTATPIEYEDASEWGVMILIDLVDSTPQALKGNDQQLQSYAAYRKSEIDKRAKRYGIERIADQGDADILFLLGHDPAPLFELFRDLSGRDPVKPFGHFRPEFRMVAHFHRFTFTAPGENGLRGHKVSNHLTFKYRIEKACPVNALLVTRVVWDLVPTETREQFAQVSKPVPLPEWIGVIGGELYWFGRPDDQHFQKRVKKVYAKLVPSRLKVFFRYCVYGVFCYFPVLAFLAIMSFHTSSRNAILSRFLAYHDPSIFNHSISGNYDIARAIPNSDVLKEETRITEEITAAKKNFDMLTNTGGLISLSAGGTIESAIRRGVHVRMIFWEYGPTNRVHYDAFAVAVKEDVEETLMHATMTHKKWDSLQDAIAGNPDVFKGSLQVRWRSKVLLHTMWIRDGLESDGIGHIGVHFGRGKPYWPCFRVSYQNGAKLMENAIQEFEDAWKESATKIRAAR